MYLKKLIALCTLALCTQLSAKDFSTRYTQFELPPGWECVLEGSEYVCQSENADRKKEAIIILAAKKRGPDDTLAKYKAYLKQARSYSLPGNKKQISEPKHVKEKIIINHKWIDALHLASEVPGFYTRYVATVKAGIGVAITFSVTKSMYDAYKDVFDRVIQSIRVFANDNTDLADLRNPDKGTEDYINRKVFVENGEDFDLAGVKTAKSKQKGQSSGTEDFLFLAIIGVVGFLVFMRMKNKKKKKA